MNSKGIKGQPSLIEECPFSQNRKSNYSDTIVHYRWKEASYRQNKLRKRVQRRH